MYKLLNCYITYTFFRDGKFVDDSGKSSSIFLGRLHDIDKEGEWFALGFNYDGVCPTEVLIIHSKFLQGVDLPLGDVIQLRSKETLEITIINASHGRERLEYVECN